MRRDEGRNTRLLLDDPLDSCQGAGPPHEIERLDVIPSHGAADDGSHFLQHGLDNRQKALLFPWVPLERLRILNGYPAVSVLDRKSVV